MMARSFPRRAAMRWYLAERYVPMARAAPQPTWHNMRLTQGLPLRIFPDLRLPALSSLPGHIQAQEDKCCSEANAVSSGPSSATMLHGATRLTPGIDLHSPPSL